MVAGLDELGDPLGDVVGQALPADGLEDRWHGGLDRDSCGSSQQVII
jgi:hypothetical protein